MASMGVCGRARISEEKVGLELFRPSLDCVRVAREEGVAGVGVEKSDGAECDAMLCADRLSMRRLS